MNNTEFMQFAQMLNEYVDAKKILKVNEERLAEIQHANDIAKQLFADAQISLKMDDPLQIGSIAIYIDCFDMIVRGKDEIALFTELISTADNFEIYAKNNGDIVVTIMFNQALIIKLK